ncbi:hypothetical protein BH10BDE1_BH10BDE1_01680 [soil metagenome]
MNQRGFTLIEVIVATVIMIGSSIVIWSASAGNYMRIEKARENANMAALLDRKMTEIELEYRGKPISDIKDEDAGAFTDEFKRYRWEMKSKEFEMPDMTSVLGGGNQDSANNANKEVMTLIVKTVSDYVKTAVKEVTVTVYYKSPHSKTKEIRQAIATYFVDYTKPLAISGLPASAAGAGGGATGAGATGGAGGVK